MKRVLVTGATGNVGQSVIRHLLEYESETHIVAGVRDIKSAKKRFLNHPDIKWCIFNFEDQSTFNGVFEDIDILFLLRPPHLSDVDSYFRPMLKSARRQGVHKIVFLSVQGVEASTIIPHNKIERLIKELDFEFIFVRPSYFMQNLTTVLREDIVEKKLIALPSGNALFNWVDVENVGEACSVLIRDFEEHKNDAFDITGTQNLNFHAIALQLTKVLGFQNTYQKINPIHFFLKKRQHGLSLGYAMVITLLHVAPRFQGEAPISPALRILTGKEPCTLEEFLNREKVLFLPETDS
jgi:uncharacterized protein YbjT (DUF2867 family)